jgi:GntR family transcriptional repressor for pyruvate dehydrogenase complex
VLICFLEFGAWNFTLKGLYYVIHLTNFGINIFNLVGNKESLSKRVASEVESAIKSRKLETGSKLPSELELCTQFGVSRTAVREALQVLSAKGIISIEKGRGIFVTGFSSDTVTAPMHTYLELKSENNIVIDVIRARMIIEPPIAQYAAVNRDESDLAIMKNNIEEMKLNLGECVKHSALDMAFHLQIAEASKNYIMPLLIQPVHKLMPEIKNRILANVPDAFGSAVEWHTKIYEAIADKDAEAAFNTMKTHLEIALQHSELMLKAEAFKDK